MREISEVLRGTQLRLFRKRLKQKQEYKVMAQAEHAGGALLPEYHRATPECPHPERWAMYDSMTAEFEVLEFIRTLVTTIKPELIVETGAFLGVSATWMAEGLRRNGFGKIVSCEADPIIFEKASQRIEASGLRPWIDLRNASSLEMKVDGIINRFLQRQRPGDSGTGNPSLFAADYGKWFDFDP